MVSSPLPCGTSRRERLLLVRDRIGILPLFYTRLGERLLFASEIKAFLPLLPVSPTISAEALDQIFTFWAPRSPNTVFEDIFEVPPGFILTIEMGRLRLTRYWDWQFPEDDEYLDGSDDELADRLYELLADATQIRLRADVPVGAYLSGGLDSSALIALIRRHSNAALKTFSIGFEESSLDESEFQQNLVSFLKSGPQPDPLLESRRRRELSADHLSHRESHSSNCTNADAATVGSGAKCGLQGRTYGGGRGRGIGWLRSLQGSEDPSVLGTQSKIRVATVAAKGAISVS